MPYENENKPSVPHNIDGNAFSVIAVVRKALIRNGQKAEADQFYEEATKGDYDHLLQTAMRYVNFE